MNNIKTISTLGIWAGQIRLHQWVKNLLLVVPALASFQALALPQNQILKLIFAFLAFSLVSSAVYVFNDISDIENDRSHTIKRHRPIAAGLVTIKSALVVAALFLLSGLSLGYFVGAPFFYTLLVYLGLTFLYSLVLKKVSLVDCISLAGLYTIRVVAGGLALGIEVSFWLLAFSVFFFFSLAWLKRYAELESLHESGEQGASGRGYLITDMPLILVFGTASAFLAVLIFALYLDSVAIREQYAIPEIGWLAIPFLLYLIGRMWFKAHRGQMNQDPILFLFRDFPSLLTVALLGVALITAHIGFGF